MSEKLETSGLEQLTKGAVRAFWMDGLWDLAAAGAFVILGVWGMYYVQYVAFRESTTAFIRESSRDSIWVGLVVIAPITGNVEHRYFLTGDTRVYLRYFILYVVGIGLLYGLFAWTKGGAHVMSVPFIVSPAAIHWAVGRMYAIQRYQWIAVIGLLTTTVLELLLTYPASYEYSPEHFLNVRPEWGGPALPCFVWAGLMVISGVIGFINIRSGQHDG